MPEERTREPQYNVVLDLRQKKGLTRLGLMSNQVWHDDPKRLTFLLSRYKFVSKMFEGMRHVLEIGCADAFGTRIVQQVVGKVTAVDFDPVFIKDIRKRMDERWPLDARVHDILSGPVEGGPFDGAYALDVLEHISRMDENRFISNLAQSLTEHGVLIIGTPSLESQPYASPPSKAGHINCKSGLELKSAMSQFFHNVFLFSMNDEVVHTGFTPMAQYLIVLCCAKKDR